MFKWWIPVRSKQVRNFVLYPRFPNLPNRSEAGLKQEVQRGLSLAVTNLYSRIRMSNPRFHLTDISNKVQGPIQLLQEKCSWSTVQPLQEGCNRSTIQPPQEKCNWSTVQPLQKEYSRSTTMHINIRVHMQDQLTQVHKNRTQIRTHSPSHNQVTSNTQQVTFSSIPRTSSHFTGHM